MTRRRSADAQSPTIERRAAVGKEFVAAVNAAGMGELLEVPCAADAETMEEKLRAKGYGAPFVWLGRRLDGPFHPIQSYE